MPTASPAFPKLQRISNLCNYLFMLGSKLIHVNEMGRWSILALAAEGFVIRRGNKL